MTDRQEYRVEGLPEPFSHYTDAVRAGDLLFISGCVALDADGKLVGEGDVVGQARQVFENIGLCLAAAGATFADVVKVTTFLTDVEDRARSTRCGRSSSATRGPQARSSRSPRWCCPSS